MISDILTVMWKERKLLFRQHGSRTRLLFTLLVPVLMFSIFLPWQIGTGWVEGYWSLLASVLIPLLLVGTVIPESFAGERERHTLGTLLASRLPDRAILFGKIALAVGYAWLMTFLTLIVSLVTANIVHWSGQITLFTPAVALTNVVLTLLLAIIMANLGVLISLRSSTVQGATQTLMAAVMFPLIILGHCRLDPDHRPRRCSLNSHLYAATVDGNRPFPAGKVNPQLNKIVRTDGYR